MIGVNDRLHGFIVKYIQPLTELGATLYRMEYEKNGADLVWLDRNDDNKTFAIAFKTIPQDDTGVFHILEHSLLCGSEKYPIKEPFVELLKSSLQTFLNAFTFPDKTMYPFSSRNDKDFLNLLDVYLDAVFHPLSIKNNAAFLQEGWHYELDSAEDELVCNGIVYNEMKGAYASPDTVLQSEMNRLLFPDNCYGFESGGHPDHITELTYEKYVECYKRFYHPSNSRIFLDGNVDLDSVLGKLDGVLSEFDKIDPMADIEDQEPVTSEMKTCYYEVASEDETKNKVLYSEGFVIGTFEEKEKSLASSVIASVLCGSNEAPLTKAVLEGELGENVELTTVNETQQMYSVLTVRNTSEEKVEKLVRTVEDTLENLAENGIDKERLESIINQMEFTVKEKDFGRMPRGIVYAINSLSSWLYGGDPAQNLSYDSAFSKLREGIHNGYFEDFIKKNLLENPHKAKLCLIPSDKIGEEKRENERRRLSEIKSLWSDEKIRETIDIFHALREHQAKKDSAEAIASLPMLSVSDIPSSVSDIKQSVLDVDGTVVLHHPVDTDGIVYTDMYFKISDLTLEELSLVSFMASLMGQLATKHYSAIDLKREIDGNLGDFSSGVSVYSAMNQNRECEPYIVVSASALEDKKHEITRLTAEILGTSDFSDRKYIRSILKQTKTELEMAVVESGNAFGKYRVLSGFSAKGAADDAMHGIGYLRCVQEYEKSFGIGDELCGRLERLKNKVFAKERLIFSLTGKRDDELVWDIVGVLRGEPLGERACHTPIPAAKTAIRIPADVGFAVKGANFGDSRYGYSGAAAVASNILSYSYLWSEIRVKGGAYGAGFGASAGGDIFFTSYRDPSANASLKCYDSAGEFLRGLCRSNEKIEKYIISTIGESEPVRSPHAEGIRAASLYLSGITKADRQKSRDEILSTDFDVLEKYSYVIDKVCSEAGVCVVAGRNTIEQSDVEFDTVEAL